jgi:Integrase core domain
VGRVPRLYGLSRLRALEPQRPPRRYQWARPGDTLHLDVKKLGRVKGLGHRVTCDRSNGLRNRGIGREYVHVCVDDASRVAYVEVLDDQLRVTTAGFLERAVAYYRLLTENGSAYRSRAIVHACARARLRHRRTPPAPTARPSASSSRCCVSAPTSGRTTRLESGAGTRRLAPVLQRAPNPHRAGHGAARPASLPGEYNAMTLHT